jgi:hypothetical protein
VIGVPGRLVPRGGIDTVMVRAAMRAERVPDPAHEEGQGQRNGEPAAGVADHPRNLATSGGSEPADGTQAPFGG